MKTFLILTEDKNRKEVQEILTAKLEGFTMYYGHGFGVGKTIPHVIYSENSLTIMVLAEEGEMVRDIAREIKVLNGQESVLVIQWDTESEFV